MAKSFQLHYFNGHRHTSRNFRSARRLVQFCRTAEVIHVFGVL